MSKLILDIIWLFFICLTPYDQIITSECDYYLNYLFHLLQSVASSPTSDIVFHLFSTIFAIYCSQNFLGLSLFYFQFFSLRVPFLSAYSCSFCLCILTSSIGLFLYVLHFVFHVTFLRNFISAAVILLMCCLCSLA